jgi:hypothetical protein
MAKKLDNDSGLLQKFRNTKAVIPLAAMALIFPISNLNATEISETTTTNRRNTLTQTNGAQTEQPAQTQQEQPTTADDVTERAEDYIGQTVTVRGSFIEEIDDNGFTITPERTFEADPILIVNATGAPLDLPDEDGRVQVTGDVREFTLDEVAQEYNLELDQATYALYENSPVLIARSIAPAPNPGEVSSNPDQYYDRQIAVEADITSIYSSQAFTLDDDLLVINLDTEFEPRQQTQMDDANGQVDLQATETNGQTDTQATDANGQTQAQVDDTAEQPEAQAENDNGERVVVTGQVRPFDEIQDQLANLDPELRTQLEENYADRPVLISDGIYPFTTEDEANNVN